MTQPTSLISDARKIAEALKLALFCMIANEKIKNPKWDETATDESAIGKSRVALPLAESLPGKIEALIAERDEALKERAVGLTVGNGLTVYGSAEAILRAQMYVLLDSKHPQEAKDTNRLLARSLQAAESQLSTVTAERDEWRACAEEKIELLQREVDAHRKRIEASNVFEAMWRSAEKETIDLESQLAIDTAPPAIAAAYARGVEHAAKVADEIRIKATDAKNGDCGRSTTAWDARWGAAYDIAERIRALIPKPSTTETDPSRPPTSLPST